MISMTVTLQSGPLCKTQSVEVIHIDLGDGQLIEIYAEIPPDEGRGIVLSGARGSSDNARPLVLTPLAANMLRIEVKEPVAEQSSMTKGHCP